MQAYKLRNGLLFFFLSFFFFFLWGWVGRQVSKAFGLLADGGNSPLTKLVTEAKWGN